MSLLKGEVNPLSVLGCRKLSFIPEHFVRIKIAITVNKISLEKWIEYNLDGRYAIISSFHLDENKKMEIITEIGFEDPKELTMLTLGCQHLYKKET